MRFCAQAVDRVTGDIFGSDRNSLVVQCRGRRGCDRSMEFTTYNANLKAAPALAAGYSVVLKPSVAFLSLGDTPRAACFGGRGAIRRPGRRTRSRQGARPAPGCRQAHFHGLHRDRQTDVPVRRPTEHEDGADGMRRQVPPKMLFDDGVDIDGASEAIAQRLLTAQGQLCSTASRLLVQRAIQAEVLERLPPI